MVKMCRCNNQQDLLSYVLEIKITLESTNLSSQGDQQLGKRWMHVHEEGLTNVFSSESTKVYLVEAGVLNGCP
jgi:hypothetical protein